LRYWKGRFKNPDIMGKKGNIKSKLFVMGSWKKIFFNRRTRILDTLQLGSMKVTILGIDINNDVGYH
jgi:hypothetical protein